jgi:glutamine amidotransferase
MSSPSIAIVDYGVGNLHSLKRAFKNFDIECVISEEANELQKAQALVLPGVGAFEAGMRGLEMRGLVEVIKGIAARGTPLFGICLGAQLFLTKGHEFGIFKGLDLIPGRVVRFPFSGDREKVPQVGWNHLIQLPGVSWQDTILSTLTPESQVYFVHSYILEPTESSHILAESIYGDHTFASVIRDGNIYGCQFHPEKSGSVGLKIIKNFIDLIHS